MPYPARLATAAWMLAVSLLLLPASTAAEPASLAPPSPVRESFRFDPKDDLVLIPVQVGGKDCLFFLDTGTTASVFDVSLRSHLGPSIGSVKARTEGGDIEVDLYSSPNAQVGSLPLTSDRVICHDLTSMREAVGRNIYGIVGMDFLQAWIVALDFDEGRCDILSPEAERAPAWGTPISFCYGHGRNMYIMANVGNDVAISFQIDTGHSGTGNLEEALLSRVVESRKADITGDGQFITLSGAGSGKVARLSHLSVGPFQHENLQFQSGRDNVLGLGYLSRYRVTIDFSHERLYLAKGRCFADHDIGHTCGMGYLFRSGHLVVDYSMRGGQRPVPAFSLAM